MVDVSCLILICQLWKNKLYAVNLPPSVSKCGHGIVWLFMLCSFSSSQWHNNVCGVKHLESWGGVVWCGWVSVRFFGKETFCKPIAKGRRKLHSSHRWGDSYRTNLWIGVTMKKNLHHFYSFIPTPMVPNGLPLNMIQNLSLRFLWSGWTIWSLWRGL